MTLTMFISLATMLSLISSLITEAIKKTYKSTMPTLIVAIISVVVGWGGGAITYTLMSIPYTSSNVICLTLLAPTIWLVATLGYDKVMEVIKQIAGIE